MYHMYNSVQMVGVFMPTSNAHVTHVRSVCEIMRKGSKNIEKAHFSSALDPLCPLENPEMSTKINQATRVRELFGQAPAFVAAAFGPKSSIQEFQPIFPHVHTVCVHRSIEPNPPLTPGQVELTQQTLAVGPNTSHTSSESHSRSWYQAA